MTLNKTPLVSIVMPAYNAGKYIAESIKSVINQTYQNWELLIVNDGSTDDTEAVSNKYVTRDSRIKLFNQVNSRLGAARNTGITNAKGEWLAFLDSDDLWDRLKLEKQLIVSDKYPEVSVIYTDGWVFFDHNPQKLILYPTVTGKYFSAKDMYHLEYKDNYIPVLSVLVKMDAVKAIGLQETRKYFYGCEDWDYWIRMAIAGANFYGIAEKLFYYRRHDNNMSSDGINMRLSQASLWIKNYDSSLMTIKQFNNYLKPFLNTLLLDLIKSNRTTDARYIINEFSRVCPINHYNISNKVINIFNRHAVLPLRIINKLDTIFNK